MFGVSLDEMCKASESKVPLFVSSILDAIQRGTEKLEEKDKVWSTPCALDRVHAACLELNRPPNTLTVEMLDQYEPTLLVAILRYFMLELPDCIMTFEMYDPVSTILTSSKKNI